MKFYHFINSQMKTRKRQLTLNSDEIYDCLSRRRYIEIRVVIVIIIINIIEVILR